MCDAEATVHDVSVRNKVRIERRLCERCAVRLGILPPSSRAGDDEIEVTSDDSGDLPTDIPLSYLSLPPFNPDDDHTAPGDKAQSQEKRAKTGKNPPDAAEEPGARTPAGADVVAKIIVGEGGTLSIEVAAGAGSGTSAGGGATRESGTPGFPPTNGRAGKCHCCGLTFAEFKQHAVLGCAECYKCFEHLLSPLLERAHEGGVSHMGKQPKRLSKGLSPRPTAPMTVALTQEDRARRLQSLGAQLSRAVSEEQYELAAKMRDEIRRLSVGEGTGPQVSDTSGLGGHSGPHAPSNPDAPKGSA